MYVLYTNFLLDWLWGEFLEYLAPEDLHFAMPVLPFTFNLPVDSGTSKYLRWKKSQIKYTNTVFADPYDRVWLSHRTHHTTQLSICLHKAISCNAVNSVTEQSKTSIYPQLNALHSSQILSNAARQSWSAPWNTLSKCTPQTTQTAPASWSASEQHMCCASHCSFHNLSKLLFLIFNIMILLLLSDITVSLILFSLLYSLLPCSLFFIIMCR